MMKKFEIIFFVFILAGINLTAANCPDLEPLYFPDLIKGLGTWYDGPYLPTDDLPRGMSCARTMYWLSGYESIIDYYYVGHYHGHFLESNGTIRVQYDGSVCFIEFTQTGEVVREVEYIRGFSANEYVSVLSCRVTEKGVEKSGYTMFRKKNPPENLVNEALDYLEREGLNTDLFVTTHHNYDCSYNPNKRVKKIVNPFLIS